VAIGLHASTRELNKTEGLLSERGEGEAHLPKARYISTLSRLSLQDVSVAFGGTNVHTYLTSLRTLVVDTTMAEIVFPHSMPRTGIYAAGAQNGSYPMANLVPRIETGIADEVIDRRTVGNLNRQKTFKEAPGYIPYERTDVSIC